MSTNIKRSALLAKGPARPPLEAAVERAFLQEVRRLNLPVKIRKMNGLGNASWPDRLIIGPKKFFMWIEFKRPEIGRLSPGQEVLFAEMGEMGHAVPVFTDGRKAARELMHALREHGVLA